MSYGDRDEFKNPRVSVETYADGTQCAHISFELWRNGVYLGYAECHTHKTKDASVSWGATFRHVTARKP